MNSNLKIISENIKTSQTISYKFEQKISYNIRNFFKSLGNKYTNLSVQKYDESDNKYFSDIKILNTINNKEIWIEVKKDKYACFSEPSFKYQDGKWTCTTIKNSKLSDFFVSILTKNSFKFIDFCKQYLKKENISIPSDISEDLINEWKSTNNIEDTKNNVKFITNKIKINDFGQMISNFYKTTKNGIVYYIQIGDDLYIMDHKYNPLGIKCKNGEQLKPLSEIYRIGRVQFRAKSVIKNGKTYYSIVEDIKILADKENRDDEYSCSFLSEDKWPVIDDGGNGGTNDDKDEDDEDDEELIKQIRESLETDENLTIPENPEDKLEQELRKKLEKNYDHADRIIRWYRNAKKSGKDEKELKTTFIDNIDNIKDLFKTYENYVESLKKMKLLNKKVELNGRQFDVVKDIDSIRLLDGFRNLVKVMGDTVNSSSSIQTSNQKYAITDEDRKKIRILGFTDKVVCWSTEGYETTNKFIYQLWLNSKTLGRGDAYGDPEDQSPYCTHSKQHWDNYSEDIENYKQFWYLQRLGNFDNIEIQHTVEKIFKGEKGVKADEYGFIHWDDSQKQQRNEMFQFLGEKFKNVEYVNGDLGNEKVATIFNLMKGTGPESLIAMNDSDNDFLDRNDQDFDYKFADLGSFGKDVESLHKRLFVVGDSEKVPINIGGVDLKFKYRIEDKGAVVNPKQDVFGGENPDVSNVFRGNISIIGDLENRNEQNVQNLIGMPKSVHGNVMLQRLEHVTSLKGMAEQVDGDVIIVQMPITSLEHFPKVVNGKEIEIARTNIDNLVGLPKDFKNELTLSGCKISSLEGCPDTLFRLDLNYLGHLKSLKGIGKNVTSLYIDTVTDLRNLDFVSMNTKVTVDGIHNLITKQDIKNFEYWRSSKRVIDNSQDETEEFLKAVTYFHEQHTIMDGDVERYKSDGPSLTECFKKFGAESMDESIRKCEESFENSDNYKFITNISYDIIENAINRQTIDNARFEWGQFEKYSGVNEMNWCALADNEKYLAIAAVNDNTPFNGYCYIAEIQTLQKGYGRHLLEEIVKKYRKVWLMANTKAGEKLIEYYRKLNFKEFIVPESVYGCPCYFYYTDECEEDRLRNYIVAFYSEEEDLEEVDEDAVDDIIADYKKIKSTNEQNPDRRKTPGSGILYLMDILDGRLVLIDAEGNTLRRDDGGQMLFDDPSYARKWAEERGYEVENDEHKNFLDMDEAEGKDGEIGGGKSDIADEVNGIKIWLDDIREAPEGFKWMKTVREFMKYVEENGTDNIALIDTDHDAGDYQKFGGDYIRCFDYLDFLGAKNITIHIHSANPVGANNIRRIISRNKEENNWKEVRNTDE